MMQIQNNHFLSRQLLPLAILLLSMSTIGNVFNAHASSLENHPLSHIEISGIALTTPTEEVSEILTAQDYSQARSSLFTKQAQLQNNRKTIFRIEVEDTAAYRQISYHRSLSGGRVKTTGPDKPVPAYEVDMAQQLYQAICEDISEEVKNERLCEPSTKSSISAGNGQWIEIDDRFTVQLNATAANTTIGIKYSYE